MASIEEVEKIVRERCYLPQYIKENILPEGNIDPEHKYMLTHWSIEDCERFLSSEHLVIANMPKNCSLGNLFNRPLGQRVLFLSPKWEQFLKDLSFHETGWYLVTPMGLSEESYFGSMKGAQEVDAYHSHGEFTIPSVKELIWVFYLVLRSGNNDSFCERGIYYRTSTMVPTRWGNRALYVKVTPAGELVFKLVRLSRECNAETLWITRQREWLWKLFQEETLV
jgi:hypothetical protein